MYASKRGCHVVFFSDLIYMAHMPAWREQPRVKGLAGKLGTAAG
jgi:hypothetical protein